MLRLRAGPHPEVHPSPSLRDRAAGDRLRAGGRHDCRGQRPPPLGQGEQVRQEPDLDHTAQIARPIVAPRYRAIRTGRYLLTKYSDGGREMYDIPRDRFMLKSVWKNRRYVPVKKFLLKALAKLVHCSGPACNQKIGKPPKPLAKPKKRKRKPATP